MSIQKLAINECYPPVLGRQEGTLFGITESGVELVYNIGRPTENEIAQFASGTPFEIKLAVVSGIIFILTKIGNMPWSDAPYNPALSSGHLPDIDASGNAGYGLLMLLTEHPTATIKQKPRLVGLGAKFSAALKKAIDNYVATPVETYDLVVQEVFRRYSTKDLLKFATASYKLDLKAGGEGFEGSPIVIHGIETDDKSAGFDVSEKTPRPKPLPSTLSRPEQQLRELLAEYPKLDATFNGLIKDLKARGERWPSDVLLLFRDWMVLEEIYHEHSNWLELHNKAQRLAAIGTWRYAKGIYRIDKTILEALEQTELPDKIPMRVLRRLLDWCPYLALPTPRKDTETSNIYGWYCYLDYDLRSGAWELRIHPDTDRDYRFTVALELSEGRSIADTINTYATKEAVPEKSVFNGKTVEVPPEVLEQLGSKELQMKLLKTVELPLKLLLYLCSEEPEIDNDREPGTSPGRQASKKVKSGYRLFEPERVRTWEVGREIGRAIEEAQNTTKSHGKITPHIRRAHWHGFWTGKRDGERKFIYHWIPPIAIGLD